MRHRILTCKNHLDLRWSTKDCAWINGYNGSRSLFFIGVSEGRMHSDGSGLQCTQVVECRNDEGKVTSQEVVHECDCPSSDLILAPEDVRVRS